MSGDTNAGAVVDKLYNALESKNLEKALACCTSDAVVWHNFDGIAMPLEQVAEGWKGMFAQIPEIRIEDIRREEVDGGLVQRHLFVMRGEDGELKGKACCIFVRLVDGLISRIDEYIDISGDLPVAEDGKTLGMSSSTEIV